MHAHRHPSHTGATLDLPSLIINLSNLMILNLIYSQKCGMHVLHVSVSLSQVCLLHAGAGGINLQLYTLLFANSAIGKDC